MKHTVVKPPKIAVCKECNGTGKVKNSDYEWCECVTAVEGVPAGLREADGGDSEGQAAGRPRGGGRGRQDVEVRYSGGAGGDVLRGAVPAGAACSERP